MAPMITVGTIANPKEIFLYVNVRLPKAGATESDMGSVIVDPTETRLKFQMLTLPGITVANNCGDGKEDEFRNGECS
jgi:hypothetical protein